MTRRTGVGLAALALVVSACGVPIDHSTHGVSNHDLPAALRHARPVTTTTTTTVTAPGAAAIVYWIHQHDVIAALETVPASAPLASVLDLLERGPSAAQKQAGDRSALTGSNLIRQVTVAGSTASIDLAPAFADALQSNQILALAQCVLTATRRPGILRVRVTVNGEPIQLPRANGSLTATPFTRRDYQSLIGRAPA